MKFYGDAAKNVQILFLARYGQSRNANSVEIMVEVKKNLVISNRVSKDYAGKSTTQKTEVAISNAVQALNEELLSLLQNDNIA